MTLMLDLGNRRGRVRCDQHEVEPGFLGFGKGIARSNYAAVFAFGIDKLDVGAGNVLIGKRPIFLGRRWSHWTTNGKRSLCCFCRGVNSGLKSC